MVMKTFFFNLDTSSMTLYCCDALSWSTGRIFVSLFSCARVIFDHFKNNSEEEVLISCRSSSTSDDHDKKKRQAERCEGHVHTCAEVCQERHKKTPIIYQPSSAWNSFSGTWWPSPWWGHVWVSEVRNTSEIRQITPKYVTMSTTALHWKLQFARIWAYFALG
jgi:hypothetical protein